MNDFGSALIFRKWSAPFWQDLVFKTMIRALQFTSAVDSLASSGQSRSPIAHSRWWTSFEMRPRYARTVAICRAYGEDLGAIFTVAQLVIVSETTPGMTLLFLLSTEELTSSNPHAATRQGPWPAVQMQGLR
jgi:hypothetical protein